MLMTVRSNQEVAAYIQRRMRELNLTKNALLAATKISPKTMTALLAGTRTSQEDTEAKVEPILRWATGSIRDIRMGLEPTPLPDAPAETNRSGADSVRSSVYEDAAVEGYPSVFLRLSRQEQLQIIEYTEQVRQQQEREQEQSPVNVRSLRAADEGPAAEGDEPPLDVDHVKNAARKTPPGHQKGQPDQGATSGDGNQEGPSVN